jgi:hypothetical protein
MKTPHYSLTRAPGNDRLVRPLREECAAANTPVVSANSCQALMTGVQLLFCGLGGTFPEKWNPD